MSFVRQPLIKQYLFETNEIDVGYDVNSASEPLKRLMSMYCWKINLVSDMSSCRLKDILLKGNKTLWFIRHL